MNEAEKKLSEETGQGQSVNPGQRPKSLLALAGAALGAGASIYSAWRNRKYNEKQVQQQNAWNLAQWNRENAYNTPAAQMARLRAAGLNPNLVYGDGGATMAAANSPQSERNHSDPLFNIDPLTASTIALNEAQARKLDSDARKNDSDIEVNESVVIRNDFLNGLTDAQRLNVERETDYLSVRMREAEKSIDKMQAEIDNMSVEQQMHWLELQLKSEEVDALCNKLNAEANYTDQQARYYSALALAKIANLNASTDDLKASKALKEAQKGLTDEEKIKVQKEVDKLKVEKNQLQFDFEKTQEYWELDKEIEIATALTRMVTSYGEKDLLNRSNTLVNEAQARQKALGKKMEKARRGRK